MNRPPTIEGPLNPDALAHASCSCLLRSGGSIKGCTTKQTHWLYAAQFFDPRRTQLAGKPPTSSIPNLRGGIRVGGREALFGSR
jgi:hypothetical protein